jgi:hypothetical protein
MRHLTLVLLGLTVLAFTACGGGPGRKTEEKLPLETAPAVTNDGGLKATLTYYKQSDRYLIVKLNLMNESKETITLHNGDGTTLPGFRATVAGQTFIAERKGGSWNPWTGYRPAPGGGSNNLEIPAGITIPIEIRWNFQMDRKDYDWAITVANAKAGEKKLSDIALAWPPAGAGQPAPAK